MTDRQLAKQLGFSHTAIRVWRERFADAPFDADLEKWRAFITKHNLGDARHNIGAGGQTLRERKLASEIRLNEIKIAKEERKLIPADDVDAFLLYLGSRVKANLFQLFVGELPPAIAGLPVEEIRARCEEKADAMCLSMQSALEQYTKEQAQTRVAANE